MMSEKAKVKSEESPLEGGRVPAASGTMRIIREETMCESTGCGESTLSDPSPQIDLYKRSIISSASWRRDGLTPLSGGDRLQSVQRSNQGWVDVTPDGKRIRLQQSDSAYTPLPEVLERDRRSSCKIRELFMGLAILFIFIGLFSVPVIGQSTASELSNNSVDTPQTESGTSDSVISPTAGGEIFIYPKLEEYLRIAIEENPDLQSLRQLYEAENERAREVGVLPYPELNIKYDFNPMMSESQLGRFSISAMQMFPWFGTLSSRRDAQRSAAEADRAEIGVRQLELIRDLQITWLNIVELQEQIRIAEKNLELLQDLKPLVHIRYETARSGQADILRIEMEEERFKNRIQDLRDQLNPAIANFNEFLNREPDSNVISAKSLQPIEISATDVELRQSVLSQNPAFEFLSAQESTLYEQMELSK